MHQRREEGIAEYMIGTAVYGPGDSDFSSYLTSSKLEIETLKSASIGVPKSSTSAYPELDCHVHGVLGIDLTGHLLTPQAFWSLVFCLALELTGGRLRKRLNVSCFLLIEIHRMPVLLLDRFQGAGSETGPTPEPM